MPGDDSGYYVARVRVIDQSGNQSNPQRSQRSVAVRRRHDAADGHVHVARRPTRSSPPDDRRDPVHDHADKNIDLTHFTAASIQVINAGPDGILGTADDITIPINPNSIQFTLLDTGTGGTGRRADHVLDQGTLTNNLYQVTSSTAGPTRSATSPATR